jgi:hypothetical protein
MTLSGGDRMTRILNEISEKIKDKYVDVGFMEGATYPNGTPVAMVAYWNEFGKTKQPPRPFFRKMITENQKKWPNQIANLLRVTNYDGNKVLGLMGEEISADLIESIRNLNEPALSPITLMLRKMFWSNPYDITGKDVGDAARRVGMGEKGATGSQAKPLEWTGTMVRAVTYKIKE